jgi:pilus assembly protein CpaD
MRLPIALTLAAGTALLAGCKTLEEPGGHITGAVVVSPYEKHPILVAQQPSTLSLSIPAGSRGLSPSQVAQVEGFLSRYRASDAGNSKLVIAVPHGGANEPAAMRAAGQLNGLVKEAGFADNAVQVQPYSAGRGSNGPIRFSYMRYVAQGPECGVWPDNLARDRRNLNYHNFGCAQQANLAAQIANPADLVTPRTMDASDPERRAVVFDKYRQGKSPASEKGADDNASVKSSN